VLQIGPFSFRVYLPPALTSSPLGSWAPERIRRLERSRRNLAGLAWIFRQRLRTLASDVPGSPRPGLAINQADLERQTAALQEQIRDYEQRVRQLEQAERDLAFDRDTLDKELASLQARL